MVLGQGMQTTGRLRRTLDGGPVTKLPISDDTAPACSTCIIAGEEEHGWRPPPGVAPTRARARPSPWCPLSRDAALWGSVFLFHFALRAWCLPGTTGQHVRVGADLLCSVQAG